MLATPYYFATPENQWTNLLVPHLPKWAFPTDEGGVMGWFFQGMPAGETFPWQVWVMPLVWWIMPLAGLATATFCGTTILRRQWVDRERLAFPLAQAPLEMIQAGRGRLPAFMESKVFWVGAGIPLFATAWNIISFFDPTFPTFPLFHGAHYVPIAPGFPGIRTKVNLLVMGFAYLTPLEVLFSVWFFHALAIVEVGILNRLGMRLPWGIWEGLSPMTAWQDQGAFLVFVALGLWMARRHLRQVVATALGRRKLDDSNEILSYRVAVLGFLGGTAVLVGWLCRSGMRVEVALGFLAVAYLIYLGLARIVAQTGVSYVTPPLVAQPFLFFSFGSAAFLPRDLAALSCAYGWHGDVQTTFMVGATQEAKLADGFRVKGRSLLPALAASAVVGLVVSIVFILTMAYSRGAANFGSWTFRPEGGMGDVCFGTAVGQMAVPRGPDWGRLGCFGGGAAAMTVLMILKYRFPWWPLHPVGLAVASVWTIRRSAFSIFLAWAAKTILLRWGGVRLYRRAAPFFLGLILGCFTGIALSQMVDAIWFPGQGHPIYNA